MIVERRVRLVTDQNVLPDLPQQAEGFPMRKWSVNIYILDEDGQEHTADCFQRVVYNLHPSFENPVQTFTKAPFTCENEGWGEFEMTIDMYTTEKSKQTVAHDLNFQSNHYVVEHTVSFKNPSQSLQQILRETGSLPTDEDRVKRKGAAVPKKASQKYDYEKLADGLARLEEADLLHVIQMITDQRTDSMYIKTDVDSGEFSIDLYSMPDKLTKDIWDHLTKKGFLT